MIIHRYCLNVCLLYLLEYLV